MLSTKDIEKIYGQPGDEANLVFISVPFPLVIAWDKTKTVNRVKCHKIIAPILTNIFNELLASYGLEKIKKLGINLYGGCYNFRKMRGGSDWSRHSWGIAIDLDPDRNSLKTKWKNCQFAKPEYKTMLEIFYKNGFVNQGLEKGFDGMHFEIRN